MTVSLAVRRLIKELPPILEELAEAKKNLMFTDDFWGFVRRSEAFKRHSKDQPMLEALLNISHGRRDAVGSGTCEEVLYLTRTMERAEMDPTEETGWTACAGLVLARAAYKARGGNLTDAEVPLEFTEDGVFRWALHNADETIEKSGKRALQSLRKRASATDMKKRVLTEQFFDALNFTVEYERRQLEAGFRYASTAHGGLATHHWSVLPPDTVDSGLFEPKQRGQCPAVQFATCSAVATSRVRAARRVVPSARRSSKRLAGLVRSNGLSGATAYCFGARKRDERRARFQSRSCTIDQLH